MYRIVCRFLPDLQYTPTGGRKSGSWRVVTHYEPAQTDFRPFFVFQAAHEKQLAILCPSPRQPNAWCSPRTILNEWLADRRAKLAGDFPILINTVDRLPVLLDDFI